MSSWFLPFLLLSVMAFGAIMLSCFTLLHARALFRVGSRAASAQRQAEGLLENIGSRLASLAAEMEQLKQRGPVVPPAGPPKPGFNLSKRTQALRMHRRGDSPDQIASALEIPLQEVELLLKVHQIVIRNL